MRKIVLKQILASFRSWSLHARIAVCYCSLSALLIFATIFTRWKIPAAIMRAHFALIGYFVIYSFLEYRKARREYMKALANGRDTALNAVRIAVEEGILDHERETPQNEEIEAIISLYMMVRLYAPEAKLELAMLDAWLDRWGVKRFEARFPR